MKISILGCGWLGFPLAQSLLQKGHQVKGSTQTPEKLRQLRAVGIEPFLLGLKPDVFGIGWDYFLDAEVLIINIPPRLSYEGEGFHIAQIQQLIPLIASSPVQKIIYINSTSVYPDLNREVVEGDVTTPEQSAAPALITVENSIMDLPQATLSLRCGGLMGYERIPAKYVAGKKDLITGDIPVNYIHRDDVIGIIEAFLQNLTLWNDTYNVVAPLHPSRKEVYLSSASLFGFVAPTFTTADNQPFKIISCQKLVARLNYSFHFANPLDFVYCR